MPNINPSSPLIGALRWLLVPIAGLATALIVWATGAALIMLFDWLWPMLAGYPFLDTWLFYASPYVINFAVGALFCIAVCYTAPTKKLATGCVMAAALVLFGLLGDAPAINDTLGEHVQASLALLALSVGIIFALFTIYDKERNPI